MNKDPLDELIERLNQGDVAAAEWAFLAYEPYLRMAVRRRLSGRLRAKIDSLDIVQSVWADVLAGFRESGWKFTDRSHLRAFLVKVARNRLIDRRREHHRALEKERALVDTARNELPQSRDPRPSEVAQGNELWNAMLKLCPPARREILLLRRQGLRYSEIALRTGLHEGSIRRIIYDLERKLVGQMRGRPGWPPRNRTDPTDPSDRARRPV
jgi:RNA polymerase sigma factor (sigma-70 family)